MSEQGERPLTEVVRSFLDGIEKLGAEVERLRELVDKLRGDAKLTELALRHAQEYGTFAHHSLREGAELSPFRLEDTDGDRPPVVFLNFIEGMRILAKREGELDLRKAADMIAGLLDEEDAYDPGEPYDPDAAR